MNNRFNFRMWDINTKRFYYLYLDELIGLTRTISIPKEATIQQYTGYNDKNNIEVYEGDILEFSNHIDEYKIGYVGFTAGSFYVNFLDDTDEEIAFLTTKDAKVIGNIFEHSELLK